MTVIPQRDLRNKVSEILRRAEQGERFTVTVSGRPVAELGPLGGNGPVPRAPQQGAPWETLNEIIAATPVDPGFAEDIRRMREEDLENSRDPWADD